MVRVIISSRIDGKDPEDLGSVEPASAETAAAEVAALLRAIADEMEKS